MESKKSNFFTDFLKSVIAALVTAVVITNFLFRFVVVDGHSMEPTLHDGQFGISWILPLFFQSPERFDIVVVKNNDVYLVKRVIGLPGETLEYNNGVLTINGEVVEEDFIDETAKLETGSFSITLTDNQYFCMGDNRGHSSDSRYYGPFSQSQIKGNGLFMLF